MSVEAITYESYPISRVVSVDSIVSADYIVGPHVARNAHIHRDAWEMLISMHDPVRVLYGGEWRRLEPGRLFFIRPGLTHDIDISADDSRSFVISFTCSGAENLLPLENTSFQATEMILALIDRIRQEIESAFQHESYGYLHLLSFHPAENSPVGAVQMISCCLEMILVMLLRDAVRKDGAPASAAGFEAVVHNYFVEQIEQYIRVRLNEPITVESIAEHFHYSRSRLAAVYKKYTGRNLKDEITDIRIKQAKFLLVAKRCSVAAAAETCGFCSPQYFSHVFQKKVGMTPTEYVRTFPSEHQNEADAPRIRTQSEPKT